MAQNLDFSKLDNPIWTALSETHQKYCIELGNLRIYQPETNPFGAMKNLENSVEEIDRYLELTPKFLIFSDTEPLFSDRLEMQEINLNQMVNNFKLETEISEEIVPLNGKHEDELYHFMKKFYPEFFRPKTSVLGDYFGIFKDNKLVAVTGERFQTDEFCEISAIVTDTEYTGRGFAQMLTSFVNNRIIERNKTPFLHVDHKNERAIKVYEKLGFEKRKQLRVFYFRAKNK